MGAIISTPATIKAKLFISFEMGFDPKNFSFQVWNEHLRKTWQKREGEGDSCVIIKLGLAQAARG